MLQMILDQARGSELELELVFFEDGDWPEELTAQGYRVEVVETGRLRQLHRALFAVFRLAGILHRRQPDLILNWSSKTHLYGWPAAALVGMGSRVAWWQHGIPSGASIDRAATALPAKAIGCCSRAAARAQTALRPAHPTFVVPAGSAVPPASTGETPDLNLPPETPVVGLVGRLQPWKGQDRLLRAVALLRDRGFELHTLIVGGDAYGLSTEYAESLKPLVDSLGLTGSVTFTGHVPDAGPYIEVMDILVNASDSEPFGIVLLEGMARRIPVMAVNSGGPAEFIEHGKAGVLARSGEPADLAEALEEILRAPDAGRALAQEAHARYLREFTDVAMFRNFAGELTRLAKH
jgi:glycosyltransferase involved in cell wall biosynthesis